MAHLSEISKSITNMDEDEARDFIREVRRRRVTFPPRKKKITKISVEHLVEKATDLETEMMIARLEESLSLSESDRQVKKITSNAGRDGI